MNRDIKFRGKRLSNDEWLYGSLVNNLFFKKIDGRPCMYIIDSDDMDYDSWEDVAEQIDDYEVDPESIDQFTGLKDKNGVEIYEGDIVKWGHIEGYKEDPIRIAEVKICPDIEFHSQVGVFPFGNFAYSRCVDKVMEVIGNVFENPELLK